MATDARRAALLSAMEHVADGDREALREVYDMTSARLLAVILRVVHDRELSEDVLQEVFIKVWNRAGRFDADRASPITWLCAIARNSAIDAVRKTGRNPEMPGADFPDVADDATDAETSLCDVEDRERLQRCLGELQENHRRSIRMAFFNGFTYSELAARLEVPLGTLKSWVRRGLASLKACLGDG